eukprot:gene11675-8316_t
MEMVGGRVLDSPNSLHSFHHSSLLSLNLRSLTQRHITPKTTLRLKQPWKKFLTMKTTRQ